MLGGFEGAFAGFTELNDQCSLLLDPFFHALNMRLGGPTDPVHERSLPVLPAALNKLRALAAFWKFPDELGLNMGRRDARLYFRTVY